MRDNTNLPYLGGMEQVIYKYLKKSSKINENYVLSVGFGVENLTVPKNKRERQKMKNIRKDKLKIQIYDTRSEMANAAGSAAAACIIDLLKEKKYINVIFAAAPSQSEMLDVLIKAEGIDWNRVNAFHMDEYLGLDKTAPQGFGNFLSNSIFSKLKFKSVSYINGQTFDIDEECNRYSKLLKANKVDLVLMGIGENGHIAFNDPHVAEFHDMKLVKAVELDLKCRQQQVNDGCFDNLKDVPKYALTLTIPALLAAPYIICTVPSETKAKAVKNTLCGEITEKCPASILRVHNNAIMFCDILSGSEVINLDL